MTTIDEAFYFAFPVNSAYLEPFYRMVGIMEGGAIWANQTGADAAYMTLNNGAYISQRGAVTAESGKLSVIQAAYDGVVFSDSIFDALRAGRLPANPGLTESEFNGIMADIDLIVSPSQSFEDWLTGQGYTLDE